DLTVTGVQTCALPICAVGAEEAEDGSLPYGQVQIIDGAVPPKLFGESRCFDSERLRLHRCFLSRQRRQQPVVVTTNSDAHLQRRSEERRVGKECTYLR